MMRRMGDSASTTPAANVAAADAATQATHDFIARWRGVTASELSTSQSFVIQLCELLGVPPPHPTPEQSYMFERPITFTHGDGEMIHAPHTGTVVKIATIWRKDLIPNGGRP